MTGGTKPSAAMRSPGAFRLYRELVEKANRTPIIVATNVRFTEAEMTWCDLTELEAEAFGIDPRLLNALVLAYLRWEDMVGLVSGEFERFRDEERAAYPQFFKGERVYSIEAAVGFMMAACELPYTQALMWVCRAQVQYVRSGLLDDDGIEPQSWALGVLREQQPEGRLNTKTEASGGLPGRS